MVMFLYENELGEIENRLTRFWIRIDDLAIRTRSRSNAFLQLLINAVNQVFDRLFGVELVSWRLVIVSGAISLSSLCIAVIVIVPPPIKSDGELYLVTGILVIALIILATTRDALLRETLVKFLATADVMFILMLSSFHGSSLFLVVPIFCFAVMSDVMVIAFNRIGLRWAVQTGSPVRLLLVIAMNVLLTLGAFAIPLMASQRMFLAAKALEEALRRDSANQLKIANQLLSANMSAAKELKQVQDKLKEVISDESWYLLDGLDVRIDQITFTCITSNSHKQETDICGIEPPAVFKDQLFATQRAVTILRELYRSLQRKNRYFTVVPVISLIAFANIDTFLISGALLVSGIILLIHRGLWPMLSRPLCRLAETGVLRNRRTLLALGLLLTGSPFCGKILSIMFGA
jgi:hypothetical protein